jgi:predicted metal-binding protein
MLCAATPEPNVCSFESLQKEKELIGKLRPVVVKHHIDEALLINTEDIAVAEWVRLKCKYGCKKYGRSWCCPPETLTPEQARQVLAEYTKAILLSGTVTRTEFYKDNNQKRRKQVIAWKGSVAIERHLFLLGYYKAFALVPETCALCKDCLYPNPCRFPTDRRPSVESFSIDVFQTLKKVGKGFRIAKAVTDEHRFYSIILVE